MQNQANLGNSVVLTPNTFVENQYEPLGARGNFQEVFDSPIDPNNSQLRIYNLMTWIGNYTLPDGEDDRHLAILGRLEWGIGATTFQADFDWKMGTQLSLAASFLRVAAAYSEIGDNVPQAGVRIGAMIASGSRASRSQVTRSYPRLDIATSAEADSIVVFPVPPFAHALNLFATDQTFYGANKAIITFLGGASNGFSSSSSDLVTFKSDGQPFFTALATEDGVRFPECTRFVQVEAADGEEFSFTPCFTLSF